MKPFYIFFLPVLLLTTTAIAQRNFREGYIVNLKGDTIRGSIDYKEWVHNPVNISFKDATGKISVQTAANTKAFYLTQAGGYEAFNLRMSHDLVSIAQPVNFLDSAKTPVSVFLKKMLSGKILDLYFFIDDKKTHFVTVEKRNGHAIELTYHYYVFNAIQNNYNGFRNELQDYAQNYHVLNDKLNDQIQNAKYTESDIVAIVQAINGGVTTIESSTKNKPVKIKEPKIISTQPSFIRFFLGASANVMSVKYTGYIDLAENPKPHTIIVPQINAGIDFAGNPDVSRLLVRVEVNAFKAGIVAESANAKKTVDMFNVAFKPQLIYNFYLKDQMKWLISSGFTYNLSSYSNLTYTVVNNKYNIIAGQQPLTPNWLSIPVKAGVVLKNRIEISASYIFPLDIEGSGALGYNGSLTCSQFGVNYLF